MKKNDLNHLGKEINKASDGLVLRILEFQNHSNRVVSHTAARNPIKKKCRKRRFKSAKTNAIKKIKNDKYIYSTIR